MSQRPVSDDQVQGEVDPTEFLRDLLRISPTDAAEVREDAAKTMAPALREEPETPSLASTARSHSLANETR